MNRRSPTDPARYALQLLDLLESWGIARADVLRRAGVAADSLMPTRDDAHRLKLAEADAIFAAAREIAGRSDLGFEFGLRLKPTAHGLLGYALIGCSDVDALWRLAARQQYHLTEAFRLHYEPFAGGGRATYTPVVPMPPDRLAFNLELFAVSTRVTLGLLLGERLPAFDIRLSMAAPAHRARYDTLAPARFVFEPRGTPGVVVTMDRAMLALPLPMAAPGVVRGVERHLAALAPRDDARASWAALVGQIARHVEGAPLTLKGVAAQLGVSARTVDRRLAAEGVRFGALCDEVRFERARELLRRGELGVAQVAERLGYRDAANFSRAFRRHAGISPSAFQAASRHARHPTKEPTA